MNFHDDLVFLLKEKKQFQVENKSDFTANIINFDIEKNINFNCSIYKEGKMQNVVFEHRFQNDNYKITIRNNVMTLKFDNDFNSFMEIYEDSVKISKSTVKLINKKTNITPESLLFVTKNINYNEEEIFDLLNINFDVNINNDDFYKKLIINLKKIETVISSNKKELNKTSVNKKDKKI